MLEAIKRLLTITDQTHREAKLAYWNDKEHCGSKFNEDHGCRPCQHFTMCQASNLVDRNIDHLSKIVRGA